MQTTQTSTSQYQYETLITKWKLITFILAGFGFHITCLLASISLSIAAVFLVIHYPYFIKFLFIPVGLAFTFLITLFVKTPESEGIVINKKLYPAFDQLLEELGRSIGTKKIHEIRIDNSYNAGVCESGFLLLPFMGKRTLDIGLELLLSVTKDEFKAILAHELSHISKKHAIFNNFMYRNRKRMTSLINAFSKKETSNPLVKILIWYIKKFNTYAFAYSRKNEFEADNNAAIHTNNKSMGNGLVRTAFMRYYVDEFFWDEILLKSNDLIMPTVKPYHLLKEWVKKPIDKEFFKKIISYRMHDTQNENDTHPPLNERLKALNYEYEYSLDRIEISAGEYYFNDRLDKILEAYNRKWQAFVISTWKKEYEERQQLKANIKFYNKCSDLDPDDLCVHSFAIYRIERNIDLVKQLIEKALSINPQHAKSNYAYGFILSKLHDDNCLKYFELSRNLDKKYTLDTLDMTIKYLLLQGRHSEAEKYLDEFYHERYNYYSSENEANTIANDSQYKQVTDLSDEEKAIMLTVIKSSPQIRFAYLVEKIPNHYQEKKIYVLAYKTTFLDLDSNTVEKLNAITLPGRKIVLLSLSGKNAKLTNKILEAKPIIF